MVVRWVPRTGELETWADHFTILLTRCHTCVLGAAPEVFRATLEARFDHLVQVRHSLGPLLKSVEDSAGIVRQMPATLTQRRFYPVNRDGPADPYLEEFVVTGSLPSTFDADVALRQLAPSPVYRIVPDEEKVGAIVYLTIHARLPGVPDAYLEWRYDPHNPAWSFEPMIRGFGRRSVSPEDISHLAYHGKRLFAIKHASSGRYPDDDEIVCRGFREDLDRVIPKLRDRLWKDEGRGDRPLTQPELAQALHMSVDTLQTRHKDCKMAWVETRLRER